MTSVTTMADLQVPPDIAWQLIGGFGSLPDWIPYVTQSDLGDGGRVRRIAASNGQRFVERLEKYDSGDRSYSYSILESRFPVTDYLAILRVTAIDGGKGSHLEWSARFTPDGVSDEEAQGIFKEIVSDGLRSLSSRYTSEKQCALPGA